MTPFRVELTSARSWTEVQMEALFAEGFPEFISGDKEVSKYITPVRESFREYDLILTDEDDQLAASSWSVPIKFNELWRRVGLVCGMKWGIFGQSRLFSMRVYVGPVACQ
jgi:hypothetical protein